MFDIPGVLVLVALIVLFGFLVTRAWRLKNGLLKWGGVVLGGLLTLIPLLVLALALVGFVKLNQHYANAAADVHVAAAGARVAPARERVDRGRGAVHYSVRLPHRAVAGGARGRPAARHAGIRALCGQHHRLPELSRRPTARPCGQRTARPAGRPQPDQ